MPRKLTIACCHFGALYSLAMLLVGILWDPKASGGMQFIPAMLAGLVYLFFCVPAKRLADSKYQKTALALAVASLVLYLGSVLTMVPLPFSWSS